MWVMQVLACNKEEDDDGDDDDDDHDNDTGDDDDDGGGGGDDDEEEEKEEEEEVAVGVGKLKLAPILWESPSQKLSRAKKFNVVEARLCAILKHLSKHLS